MTDAIIAIVSAFATVYVAFVGVMVTLKPPEASDEKAQRWIVRKLTAAAVLTVVLIGIQAYRNAQVIEVLTSEERSRVDAIVDVVGTSATAKMDRIEPARKLGLNLFLVARHNTAYKSVFKSFGMVLDGHPSMEQGRLAWETAWNAYKQMDPTVWVGNDIAPDEKTETWNTVYFAPLTQAEATGLISGTKTLYAIAFIRWKNPSGSESSRAFCYVAADLESGDFEQAVISSCPARSPY